MVKIDTYHKKIVIGPDNNSTTINIAMAFVCLHSKSLFTSAFAEFKPCVSAACRASYSSSENKNNSEIN